MALHKCSKCGARYPDDIAACPQCGQATKPEKKTPKRVAKTTTEKKEASK